MKKNLIMLFVSMVATFDMSSSNSLYILSHLNLHEYSFYKQKIINCKINKLGKALFLAALFESSLFIYYHTCVKKILLSYCAVHYKPISV